jgi:hypothetical protein
MRYSRFFFHMVPFVSALNLGLAQRRYQLLTAGVSHRRSLAVASGPNVQFIVSRYSDMAADVSKIPQWWLLAAVILLLSAKSVGRPAFAANFPENDRHILPLLNYGQCAGLT